MKLVDKVKQGLSKFGNASKVAVVSASSFALSTCAQAEVTFTEAAGFSGSIDTKYFTTAVVVLVGFLGVALAVKLAVAVFKRG